MSALSIQPTYPIFTDIDGQPLEAGYVWIGTANLDPQTNPITVYWDAALTILAPQPIRTLAGYPSNNGTPARLYVNSDYSIRVMNKNGSTVYSAPAATERYSGVVVDNNAGDVTYDPPFAGAVSTTVEGALAREMYVEDFGAVGDGVANETAAFQAALAALPENGKLTGKPGSTYLITQPLTYTGALNLCFTGCKFIWNSGGTLFRANPNSNTLYTLASSFAVTTAQTSMATPAELSGVVAGDVLLMESNDINLVNVDGNYLKGQTVKVLRVSGGNIFFYPAICQDFTVLRIRVYGKTEGTTIRDMMINGTGNTTNASYITVDGHSDVLVDNVQIYGGGPQNVGISVFGVNLKVSNCTVQGVLNNNTPLGYGVNVGGSNIDVSTVSGTQCRHLVDGSSRNFISVNLSIDRCNATKSSDTTKFLYALGMHANVRNFSVTNCTFTGEGLLLAVRCGEGVITGNTFINKFSNTSGFASIGIIEEGVRNIVIANNTFSGSNEICILLATDAQNRNIVVANNTVFGDNKIFFKYQSRGHRTRNLLIEGNTGLVQRIFVDDIDVGATPESLDMTIRNNVFESSEAASGYFISVDKDYDDLRLDVIDNRIYYLTSSAMMGVTGDIVGDLELNIRGNISKDNLVDSYYIRPASVGGDAGMMFTENEFDGQLELELPAATYSPIIISKNISVGRSDPFVIITDDMPVLFRDNVISDSNNCRFWRSSQVYHPGNVNLNGIIALNGSHNYGTQILADGTWSSTVSPQTFDPLVCTTNWPRGTMMLKTDVAAGGSSGWMCTTAGIGSGGVWKALPNVAV
jgi:hypothetical protein